MNYRKKAVFNWSGGKDSALALQKILNADKFEVISLFTTINEETQKSSIHSIPLEILLRQAKSIGIPLYTMSFAKDLKNYDSRMLEVVHHFKTKGVTHFIFGDISLSDIKSYREKKLKPLGINIVEPLWDKTSEEAINDFLKSGIKAKIIVTQADKLDQSYIGKELNEELIDFLPDDVDVCGEDGAYHTLSYGGGLFNEEIPFSLGETYKTAYEVNLDNRQSKIFEYWQAEIIV